MPSRRKLPEHLIPRELSILAFYARGMSDKQIADKLDMNLSTVTTHGQRLRQRLAPYVDANGNIRVQMALIGIALGLAKLPEHLPNSGENK